MLESSITDKSRYNFGLNVFCMHDPSTRDFVIILTYSSNHLNLKLSKAIEIRCTFYLDFS